jgi:hypothetical protein
VSNRPYYLKQATILLEIASRISVKADAAQLIQQANQHKRLADACLKDEEAEGGGIADGNPD